MAKCGQLPEKAIQKYIYGAIHKNDQKNCDTEIDVFQMLQQ